MGCIPSSLVADRLGRRKAIILGSSIFIVGGVLQTAAQNKEMMLLGRLFAGVGIGMLSFLGRTTLSKLKRYGQTLICLSQLPSISPRSPSACPPRERPVAHSTGSDTSLLLFLCFFPSLAPSPSHPRSPSPSIRGRLTTLQQLFLGIGAFIASFVGYGCTKNQLGTAFQWRFPLGLQSKSRLCPSFSQRRAEAHAILCSSRTRRSARFDDLLVP